MVLAVETDVDAATCADEPFGVPFLLCGEGDRCGEKAGCSFDWALLITEFVLLGNLAVRTGRAVAFDPKTLHVTNNSAADALIRLKYYNGWSLS